MAGNLDGMANAPLDNLRGFFAQPLHSKFNVLHVKRDSIEESNICLGYLEEFNIASVKIQ